jgi:predicted alpha/beta hydrolase family esterase
MKKVFIIHGFEGSPNGGWRPWLMAELEKQNIYACALSMPDPENPVCNEWVEEISRHIERNKNDEIYLIGHSLGSPAILRYLESQTARNIAGAILVSSPSQKNNNRKLDSFLDKEFDFEKIKSKCKLFSLIHGDNDPLVPLKDAIFLSQKLQGDLITIKNGKHLNGSAGFLSLPQCLEVLLKMMKKQNENQK